MLDCILAQIHEINFELSGIVNTLHAVAMALGDNINDCGGAVEYLEERLSEQYIRLEEITEELETKNNSMSRNGGGK